MNREQPLPAASMPRGASACPPPITANSREPAALVLLEWALWMGVLLLVGLVIARVYELRLDGEGQIGTTTRRFP